MSTDPTSAEAPHTEPTDAEWDALWKRRHELLNWCGITFRYHRKRQWFFGLMDKLTQVAAVIGGLAFLGKTLTDWLPVVGALISGSGLLALVFGYSDKRQAHKELAELANQLSCSINTTILADLDEARLCEWEAQRGSIDMREPPNLKTLVSKCEWEQAVFEGHKDHARQPKWWQQAHMHFF